MRREVDKLWVGKDLEGRCHCLFEVVRPEFSWTETGRKLAKTVSSNLRTKWLGYFRTLLSPSTATGVHEIMHRRRKQTFVKRITFPSHHHNVLSTVHDDRTEMSKKTTR
jgi:hypothetical protein